MALTCFLFPVVGLTAYGAALAPTRLMPPLLAGEGNEDLQNLVLDLSDNVRLRRALRQRELIARSAPSLSIAPLARRYAALGLDRSERGDRVANADFACPLYCSLVGHRPMCWFFLTSIAA